jgi:murein L,D-transpeptidase YafK
MIEELYVLTTHAKASGQDFIPVHIFSAKYDDKKSNEYLEPLFQRDASLKTFEHQLKRVYDFFNQKKKLPVVAVLPSGEYVFY